MSAQVAIPENVLTNPRFKMWPTNTRAIVGSVLIAVAFTVNMQITERIDTALFGGILYWFGLSFFFTWSTSACIWYGLVGGLIMANFNPLIAVLTATSPMAPRFFIDNTLFVIPFSMLVSYIFRTKGYMNFKTFFLMCTACLAIDLLAPLATWILLFKFSPLVTLGWYLAGMTTVIPGAWIAWQFNRAIQRSGVTE